METGADERAGKRIPEDHEQSQYAAEFYAVLMAVRKVSVETALTIVSAQPYVQEAMNKKLGRWENEGWVGVKHRDILRCVAAELKARAAPTFFKVAEPGTPARAACRKAAKIAKRAARAQVTGVWDMTLPTGMTLPGLRLQGNRQKNFYRSIREEKTEKLRARPSTANKLKVIRDAVYDTFGREVTDAQIWNSLLVKDFLPRPSQFFWKCVHNAHKVGSYWTHIPDCGDRATCRDCGEPEDLEHILVRCESPGREMIWAAAQTLWLERQKTWPEISLGTILGCGLAEFRDSRGKIDRGAQRLYRVLISESAYLIWRLRNERVIDRDGEPASEEEIMNKFKFAINQRLQMDRLLANRPRRGKLPRLPPKLVLATWSGIMDNEHSLPTDWLGEPRVLVGNRAFPPRTPFRQDENQGIG
ncbi:ribonuclease H-like protein [Mycena pura]|uniref:Ribonuclease H-like protein n=1 Tax=Mycena pura TaxID=153505 RepID=A0AAD6UPL0_9AGAR|nr:ribonuclease H-like protein [Mycena pura]